VTRNVRITNYPVQFDFLNFFIFLFFRAKDPRVYKYPVPDPALYQKLLLAYEHCLKNTYCSRLLVVLITWVFYTSRDIVSCATGWSRHFRPWSGLHSQRGGALVRKAHLYGPWSIQLGRTAALYLWRLWL
jgi:hypothetical protein